VIVLYHFFFLTKDLWLKGYRLKHFDSFPLKSIDLSRKIIGQQRQGMSPGILISLGKYCAPFTSDESWYK